MTTSLIRSAIAILSAALLFGVLATCAQQENEEVPSVAEISWGGPKNIAMLPIIAQQKGLFAEQRLSAKPSYLQTGKITLDAVVRGDIQFGVVVEATIAFAGLQDLQDVKIIAVNQEKLDDAVVARKDHGIVSPVDLVGKRLAVTQGTNSQMYAYRLLEVSQVDPKGITIVNLSPPAIVAALNNGEVDAGSVWQPFRHSLNQQLGDKAINFENQGIYTGYALIAVRESWANEHPEIVEQFLRVLISAEEFIREHHSEAIQIIASEIDLAPELLEQLWGEYRVAVSLPPALIDVMTQEGNWILANMEGFAGKSIPDYGVYLDHAPLRQIDEARVQ